MQVYWNEQTCSKTEENTYFIMPEFVVMKFDCTVARLQENLVITILRSRDKRVHYLGKRISQETLLKHFTMQNYILYFRMFDVPLRKTHTSILEAHIFNKCHSAYRPQSLKVKFNI